MRELSMGLCTESMLHRIEAGERETNKLLRDRLLGRLGIAADGFEEYLKPSEYAVWEHRKCVLEALDQHDLPGAEKALSQYYVTAGRNDSIGLQFYYVMQSKLLDHKSAARKEELLWKAIQCTMPADSFDEIMEMSLDEQEINILLEYLDLLPNDRDNVFAQFPEELLYQLIRMIEKRSRGVLSMAKVYPKAVYIYYKKTQRADHRVYDMCNRAIDVLRTVYRTYYLVELLEMCERFIKSGMEAGDVSDGTATAEGPDIESVSRWKNTIIEIYKEYSMNPKMEYDTYFYRDNEIYKTSYVIRQRREMLGLSRKELSERAGCSEKAVIAAESGRSDSQKSIVKGLFIALNLPAEYMKHEIITDIIAALHVLEKTKSANIEGNRLEEDRLLEQLATLITSDNPANRQYLEYRRAMMKKKSNRVNAYQCLQFLREALEITVPLEVAGKRKKKNKGLFYSRVETMCLLGMMIMAGKENDEDLILANRMAAYFLGEDGSNTLNSFQYGWEMCLTQVASIWGNHGLYSASDALGKQIIKTSLANRRLYQVAANNYGIWWNDTNHSHTPDTANNRTAVQRLRQCIAISDFCKRKDKKLFYQKKLDEGARVKGDHHNA